MHTFFYFNKVNGNLSDLVMTYQKIQMDENWKKH